MLQRQQAFGYTHEDLRILLAPMANKGEEPVGSMGTDTPLAVLSDRPRLLYDYFKQLFAQVTNPPLDAIREELVTSMETTIGPEGNLLEPRAGVLPPDQAPRPRSSTTRSWRKLRHVRPARLQGDHAPMLFPVAEGAAGLARALEELCRQASQAIADGLQRPHPLRPRRRPASTRPSRPARHRGRAPPPRSARATRTRVGLVIETGEAREVHHMCLLIGYGAGAINP